MCTHFETRTTEKDPSNHVGYSEWTVEAEADCLTEGSKFRVCLGCGDRQTDVIPTNETNHLYGAWRQTLAPTCTNVGSKTRKCSQCNHEDTADVPVDPTAHKYIQVAPTPATCTTPGRNNAVCEYCDKENLDPLPLDTHNHSSAPVGGVCPDCGGMLSEDLVLDNSTGKDLQSFRKYLTGDFKLIYEFDAKAGMTPDWDNFILDVAPAGYINGKLYRSLVGRIMLVPYPRGGNHYGTWWQYYNGTVENSWFFDENGVDLIYQTCVQKGVSVVMTLERVGAAVKVDIVMTVEMNGKNYDCTVSTVLNYPGIETLCVALTGEDSSLTLNQATLAKGTLADDERAETGTDVFDSPVTVSNPTGKNADGLNITMQDGDFDVEYDFTVDGDPNNDWSNWLMHMFTGTDDFTVGGSKHLWTGTANGNYSEFAAQAFKNVFNEAGEKVNWQFQANTGNFTSNLAHADIKLRISRKNGIITLFGTATAANDDRPFAYYTDTLNKAYVGALTLRLTTEKSSLAVNGFKVYSGKATEPGGACFIHSYGEWQTVTEAIKCVTGLKRRTCSVCNNYETEVIPAPEDHDFNEWQTVAESLCGTPGQKKRTCKNCAHFETEVIPASGSHSYGDWKEDSAASCISSGSRHKECSICHDTVTEELPKDIYAHTVGENGVCNNCRGILSEAKTIDCSAAKYGEYYDLYLEGDFELIYSFENVSGGVDYNWDNFILTIDQATYLNGKIVVPKNNKNGANRGDFDTVPYMNSSDANAHYGLFWNKFGNSMTTTWFSDSKGSKVAFADAMKTNPDVVATVKRTGDLVVLTYVITADMDNDVATCTVVYNIRVAAAKAVWLGLTGEECVLNVRQVKLISGAIVPAEKIEQGESLLGESKTIVNTGKNQQYVDVTLGDGDFDLEYRFESADEAGRGDWDNWLIYMFKDSDDFTVSSGHKVYWSMTANGAEPENYATVYQDVNWSCFNKRDYDDFGKQIVKHCTFTLRITRKGGFITVIGDGYLDGENTPFVRWAYNTYKITYDGKLTIRLTSQKSTLTVNDIIRYAGTATGTDGLCVMHKFGAWSTVTAATCSAPGQERRICSECNKEETRAVPATGLHDYPDAWETVTEPLCGDPGQERRKCNNCDHYETREIPATGSHSYGEWTTTAATCTTVGERRRECSTCHGLQKETLPVDPYAHTRDSVNGICPDCHGMLTEQRVVDNTGVKGVDVYSHYFQGDFKLVYEYYAQAGENGEWHNFIFKLAPAVYENGNITDSPMGRIMFLPFPKDKNHYCGGDTGYNWWKVHGIQVNTNWFFSADGTDLGFQNCVKAGVNVVATLERIGDNVNVRIVMTYDHNGEPVDCVVTTVLAYPGIENLFVGLTGESSSLTLKQFKVESGTFSPLTFDKVGTNVIETPVELNNTGVKNQQGLNYAFEGDFDVEYDLTLAGDDVNDWHSWILYMFKDADNLTVGSGNKLFYCSTANGEYSEGYVPTYKIPYKADGSRDGNWNFRADTGNFAANLQNSKAKIRITRKNGQITVTGYGYKDDGTVFVRYVDPVVPTYDGVLTLRFTSELCVCTVTGLTVYEGTPDLITNAE